MRILVISPFFYPEPISSGKFNTDMVLALKNKGYEVTIICSHPIYPKWEVELSDDVIDGVDIIRGGSKIKYSKKVVVRRMILELWYAFFVVRKGLKLLKNSDLIIPVFPPSLAFYFLRFFLKDKHRSIGIVHDLQEVYSSDRSGFLSKVLSKVIRHIESKTFISCDKVVYLSNEMKDAGINYYGADIDKSVTQYPFVTLTQQLVHSSYLDEVIDDDKINVVYSGALGDKQNPHELVDLFHFISKKDHRFNFHIFSQGIIFDEIKSRKSDSVFFHDLVPKEHIEYLYKKSDIQVIPQLPKTSKGSLPSKLPNLIASDCKILVITDSGSEIEQLFFNNPSIGKAINTWDFERVYEAILYLIDTKVDTVSRDKIVKSLFTIDSLIEKIVE